MKSGEVDFRVPLVTSHDNISFNCKFVLVYRCCKGECVLGWAREGDEMFHAWTRRPWMCPKGSL